MALCDGIFAARGVDLRLVSTENSKEQRTGLARGDFQLVHVAFDNAVSMRDVDGEDVIVVMGGDSGMNELFVQSEITSIEAIKGKRLIVDSPDTAFALQAYKILSDHGLFRDRDYEVKPVGRGELRIAAMLADKNNSAAILNLPYSLDARRLGFRSLGDTTNFVGPYQAGSAFVMRPWAQDNRDLLVRYIAAYLEGLHVVLDPQRHEDCVKVMLEELGTERQIAEETLVLLRAPGFGLEPNAVMDEDGMRNTLALRASLQGAPVGDLDPYRYIDPSYHTQALHLLHKIDGAGAR
jgi:ABC-type nitrate/sulfonate/bicarbonate transport system substrate-binding protein